MHFQAVPLSLLCLFAVLLSGIFLIFVPGTVIWDSLWRRLGRKCGLPGLLPFETFILRLATGILFQTAVVVLISVTGVFHRSIPILSSLPFLILVLLRPRPQKSTETARAPLPSPKGSSPDRRLFLLLALALPPLVFYQLNVPLDGMDDIIPVVTAQRLVVTGDYVSSYTGPRYAFVSLNTLPACLFPFVPVKNLRSGYIAWLGVLLVISMYNLARCLFGKRAAFLATACLLAFPLYDRVIEVRDSILSLCFLLLALYFVAKAILDQRSFHFYLAGLMFLVATLVVPVGTMYGLLIFAVFLAMRGLKKKRLACLLLFPLLGASSAVSLRLLHSVSPGVLQGLSPDFLSYHAGNYSLLALLSLGGFLISALSKKEKTTFLAEACLCVIFLPPVLCLVYAVSGLEILSAQHFSDVFKSNKEWFMAIPLSLWAGFAISRVPSLITGKSSARGKRHAGFLSYCLAALILILPHQLTVYRAFLANSALIREAMTRRLEGERGIILTSFLPGSFTSSHNPFTAPLTMKWGYIMYRGTRPVCQPAGRKFLLTVWNRDISAVIGTIFYSPAARDGHYVYPAMLSGIPRPKGELDAPFYENFIDKLVLSQYTGLLPAGLTAEESDVLYGRDSIEREKLIRSKNVSWIIIGPGESEKFPEVVSNLGSDPSLSLDLETPTYSVFRVR